MVEVYFSWHFPGVERLKRLHVQSACDIVTPLRYLKLELRSSSGTASTASKHQYKLYHMEEHDPTVSISASLCGRRNGRLDDFGWSRHCICEAPGGLIDESCSSSPVDPCLGFLSTFFPCARAFLIVSLCAYNGCNRRV